MATVKEIYEIAKGESELTGNHINWHITKVVKSLTFEEMKSLDVTNRRWGRVIARHESGAKDERRSLQNMRAMVEASVEAVARK